MKLLYPLSLGAILALGGCQASTPPPVVAPTAAPAAVATPLETAPVPAATPRIVQSGRSSLPPVQQMMGNEPRPTFVPRPTPKVRPGQTIIISNAPPTPAPRQNPTIIVSNAPIPGTGISSASAAAQGLVWVNTKSKTGLYFRPGERGYGGTIEGFYTTEARAIARGYRAALR